MHLTPRLLAITLRRMLPIVEATCGVEAIDVFCRLCDADAPIGREDATTLAAALLVELQKRQARPRAPRR
jgi:hypothetical protein